jgi:hypothetical protein
MDIETLNFWANVSIIVLAVEAIVIGLAIGAAFFYARRYVKQFRLWLKLPLLQAQVYMLRTQKITGDVSNAVVGVPMALSAGTERVTATTRALTGGKRKEGVKDTDGKTV